MQRDDDLVKLRAYIDHAAAQGGASMRLPPEPDLSQVLGISRARLRALLRHLQEEGLIWRHVGKGTFVGPRPVAANDRRWAAGIGADDIFDARVLLEPQWAAQAALRATPTDIAMMEQCLAEMTTAGTFMQWKRLDERLHRLIAQATHNLLLLMLHDSLRMQVPTWLDAKLEDVYGTSGEPKQAIYQERREIIDAIRSHDPTRAEQAMREHVRSVRTHLFGLR